MNVRGRTVDGAVLQVRKTMLNKKSWWLPLGCLAAMARANAQGTAFSYQGRLSDGARPANGSYDFSATLHGTATGRDAVLGSQVFASIGVTNGLFNLTLDFGVNAFDGSPRWVEIGVRTNGAASFTDLSPRRQILPAPQSVFAATAATVSSVRASAITGVIASSNLPPVSLDGGSLTNINAAQLTTGTVPDGRLDASIARVAGVEAAIAGASNALASASLASVLSASNVLGTRLVSTNDALVAQVGAQNSRIDQLAALVAALTNRLATVSSPNSVIASRSGNDPALASLGMVRFARLDGGAWRDGAASGAPSARTEHVAAWIGQRMWIWGGKVGGLTVNTGAEYNPSLNSWSSLSPLDAPSARYGAVSAWTGTRVVVWGGKAGSYLGDGATYHPESLTWAATSSTGAPAARSGHVGAWTGSRFVVWGGRNATGLLSDGALLDIGSQSWSPLPSANAPQARYGATIVWAGDRLIIFGGEGAAGQLAQGASLPMAAGVTPGSWASLASANAPSPRAGHTAVWTGSKMLVWGGMRNYAALGDGAAYDPATDTWSAISSIGAPGPRSGHMAVWTGQEMVVVGGSNASGPLADSAAYDPVANAWISVGQSGTPLARSGGSAIWNGDEMLVFGGETTGGESLAALQRLNPQSVWYLYRNP